MGKLAELMCLVKVNFLTSIQTNYFYSVLLIAPFLDVDSTSAAVWTSRQTVQLIMNLILKRHDFSIVCEPLFFGNSFMSEQRTQAGEIYWVQPISTTTLYLEHWKCFLQDPRVSVGWRFATALLPRLLGKNPRSHHKGANGRV